MLLRTLGTLFCTLLFAAHAGAATCGGDFNAFLSAMAREAAAAGVSRSVLDSAFAGLMPDGAVLAFDRRQRGTFRKSFEEYAATRVIPPRIKRAKQLMQRHAALLARVERQFGVPATLLMAIWALESDNSTGDMGKLPVIEDATGQQIGVFYGRDPDSAGRTGIMTMDEARQMALDFARLPELLKRDGPRDECPPCSGTR